MSKRRYELDTRIFVVFLFVAMPFMAFGSFVVVSMAQGALQERIAQNLEQRAIETKFYVERHVGDQILHLRLLGSEDDVVAQLGRPTQEPGANDARRRELAEAAPLARRLRDVTHLKPEIKLLQAIDTSGRVVAASGRGGRALHADAGWFQELSRDPLPAPWVGDVTRPTESSLALMQVAFPVYDREGAWIGALLSLVDADDLYSVLSPVRIGRTGHAVLMRSSDGVVLASEDQRALAQPYSHFDSIQAARRERRGFWKVSNTGAAGPRTAQRPEQLIGFSAVDQVPGVEWLVVVEQDLAEAHAPIAGVTRYLWIHFIGALGTVILLALYFSFKFESPVIDEQLHLHERHVPSEARSITG